MLDAAQQVEAPSFWGLLLQELQMILALLAYLPYVIAVGVVALTIAIAIHISKQGANRATADPTSINTTSTENYSRIQDFVGFFLDKMDAVGQPGKEKVSLERIRSDKDSGDYWGYGPIIFNIPANSVGWQAKGPEVAEPGGWKSPKWREVIILPSERWAILGYETKTMHAHGKNRDINKAVIVKGSLVDSGEASDAALQVMAGVIRDLLESHSPSSLPEFLSMCADSD